MSELTIDEAVLLGATDTIFFGHFFFPKSMRQESPQWHYDLCNLVETPENRLVAVKVHRGGAKTTLLRIIIGKRIGYGLSRTILVVSETATHSVKTIRWIKKAIEDNPLYTSVFGLKRGDKWAEDEIEIINTVLGIKINIVGNGIFGQNRGLNIDDFRPDLIICDDIHDEENVATLEMREKVKDTLYGAILPSLAPASECPTAKLVMLQTPLHRDDCIEQAMSDPTWKSISVSCFNSEGQSNWPQRWSTEELEQMKDSFRHLNRLSVWYREYEVTVTAEELTAFISSWLKYYTHLPEGLVYIMAVDPTPPPKESKQLGQLKDLDDAVIMVLGIGGNKLYIADYYICKSPDPMEFCLKIIEMHRLWRPLYFKLETVLFQRVLKSFLELVMAQQRYYFACIPVEDKRKKRNRITQAVTNYASQGMLHVRREHRELIDQFCNYPDVSHDDVLDALAICLDALTPDLLKMFDHSVIDGEFEDVTEREWAKLEQHCP